MNKAGKEILDDLSCFWKEGFSSPEAIDVIRESNRIQENILQLIRNGCYVFIFNEENKVIGFISNEEEFVKFWNNTFMYSCLIVDKDGCIYNQEGENTGHKVKSPSTLRKLLER